MRGEVDNLRTDKERWPPPIVVYPSYMDEKLKLIFVCLKKDNLIEFLLNCEQEMGLKVNDITDTKNWLC